MELCCVTPRLDIIPVLLLVIPGRRIKVFAVMYYVTLVYGTIKIWVMGLIPYLYSALPSPLYFRSDLVETITSCTLYFFSLESQSKGKTPSFTFPFCSSLVTIAFDNFEDFEYTCDVETSTILLLATRVVSHCGSGLA